jgi:hypothetical protein
MGISFRGALLFSLDFTKISVFRRKFEEIFAGTNLWASNFLAQGKKWSII